MPERIKKTGQGTAGDISGDIANIEMSPLSLIEQARLSALIDLDGADDLRQHLMGAIGRTDAQPRRAARELPTTWTLIHVLDRLEEAFTVLAALPARTRPKQYGNAMPTPVQERMSFKDLIDMSESGELEQMEADRNRVRLAVTAAQVTRMDEALRWPAQYLADRPEMAKAVSLRALWAAMRTDIRKRCERRGIDHTAFNAHWQAGAKIITATLIARRVPVS